MSLAPIFAIAATFGLQLAREALANWPRASGRCSSWAVGAVTTAVVAVGLTAQPHRLDREQVSLREAASWLRSEGTPADRVTSTHVWLCYYFPLPAASTRLWSHPHQLNQLPSGSVVVWDFHYSEPWGLRREELTAPGSGWSIVREYDNPRVEVYLKT